MFKVVSDRTFTHDVEVLTPVDGGHEKQTFKATFALVPLEEVKAVNINAIDDVTMFLTKVVRHMDDLVDEKKQPLPYSAALRDQLIQQADVRTGLMRAYGKALTKAAEGN